VKNKFYRLFSSFLFCLTKKETKKSSRQESHRTTASAPPADVAAYEAFIISAVVQYKTPFSS
jgi:hypothetical protein